MAQLSTALVSSSTSSSTQPKQLSESDLLSEALAGLVECAEDDVLVKDVNLKVLMQTRSEDVRVRLAAVQCATAIWAAQGHKLRGSLIYIVSDVNGWLMCKRSLFAGFASETGAFILECAEDENDEVVRATRRLRDAVENVSGKIDGL